jgi:hypothetical protein
MKNKSQWLIPINLATWDAEIKRIQVQGLLGEIVQETLPP